MIAPPIPTTQAHRKIVQKSRIVPSNETCFFFFPLSTRSGTRLGSSLSVITANCIFFRFSSQIVRGFTKEKNGFFLDMYVFSKFKSIIVQSESHTSSRSYTQKPTPNKWLANIIDKISSKSQVKKSLIITH